MRRFLVSAFGFCASTVVASNPSVDSISYVDAYITAELPIAQAGLLANIGPNGTKSSGAFPGVVIASPSTSNPNYLYSWVRDSSLVFKTLIDQYYWDPEASVRTLIDDFVHAQANIQQLTNPSGSVLTGGLGEPKFYINETAFEGPWGRPQRDGPALRSTAIITYANSLLRDNNSYVNNTLWPIIKLDLDYVTDYWNQTTFDLWEEVDSSSFFTSAVQHRALRQGAALATAIGQTSVVSKYNTQANNILCFLQSFWDPQGKYMTSNTGGGRSGIDANSILAAIHIFDFNAGCDATTFQPCSDIALSNLKVYVDSFRSIYPINSGLAHNAAAATGRYAEDVYQGGNPWYLTTFAVAEQLYDALIVWLRAGSITVTSTSLPFFQQFSPELSPGTYNVSTSTFDALINAIKDFADDFIALNAKYTPRNGGLAEQYSKSDGTPVSAVDLTWSYASALTAFAARASKPPASWGASNLTVESQCQPYSGPTVAVTFNVNAQTTYGQYVYLTGSVAALHNWDPSTAISMSPYNYPIWSVTVDLPANSAIQYKYIKIDNGNVIWETDPNDELTTAASGTQTVNSVWH